MIASPSAIAAVGEILTTGESAAGTLSALAESIQLGLWSHDTSTSRIMARTALVHLAARLPNIDETIAAVFSCQSELRPSWLRIVAARLREAGKRVQRQTKCAG